jgi:hypothetical protein
VYEVRYVRKHDGVFVENKSHSKNGFGARAYPSKLMALLPHSYFRFVSLWNESAWQKLERTICESHLPTSVIADFNDPFESGPILFGDRSQKISIEGSYAASTVWSPLVASIWNELVGKTLSAEEIIQTYTAYFSVVSLSRRINSGLVWSHYSNGYRGIALHFTPINDQKSPFRQSHFQWMTYEKQRPIISIDHLRRYLRSGQSAEINSAFELQFIGAILFWKSEDWAYEQEARLVTGSTETAIPFPPQELASVILGPRVSAQDAERVALPGESSLYRWPGPGFPVRTTPSKLTGKAPR